MPTVAITAGKRYFITNLLIVIQWRRNSGWRRLRLPWRTPPDRSRRGVELPLQTRAPCGAAKRYHIHDVLEACAGKYGL